MCRTDELSPGVDERIERLICRCLDQEAGSGERAELADLVTRESAVRALFEDYERLDKAAAEALHRDLGNANTVVAPRRFRGLWLATAGAVLAAAAVVTFSFLPGLWSPSDQMARNRPPESPVMGQVGAASPMRRMVHDRSPQMIDYREAEPWPSRRLRDVRRDLIGIRGKNKDVIYIFERDTHSTRIVPISGDI